MVIFIWFGSKYHSKIWRKRQGLQEAESCTKGAWTVQEWQGFGYLQRAGNSLSKRHTKWGNHNAYFTSTLNNSMFMHAARQSAFKKKLLQNIFVYLFLVQFGINSMNEWLLITQGGAECNYVIHECIVNSSVQWIRRLCYCMFRESWY